MRIHIDLVILHCCCLLVGTYTYTARASSNPGLRDGGQHVLSGEARSYYDAHRDSPHTHESAIFDNGLTKVVQWDNSTLYINGQKVFIYSGEFHYWRIPVPSLYLDIFQKLRASGYNAVSIYFHWGYHNPAEGIWDFDTGAHYLQPIFDAAKTAGLWVIARPGPYIHAETSAGGLPGWLVQLPNIEIRTNGSQYTKHWQAYIEQIGPIIARNQVGGNGTGTVILAQIENEYFVGGQLQYEGSDEYMAMLSIAFRAAGITVPIFHNDVSMTRSWLPHNNPNVLELYGLDSYPRYFDCSDPLANFYVRTNYYDYFKRWYSYGPQYTAEFQGGSYDSWGGPGYEKCAEMVGLSVRPSFVNVYYKNNVAQRFTMMNFYMSFGGTNWGHLLTPVVYTSYDYGAGISESRLIRDKLSEGKLLALMLRTMDALSHANLIGNTTSPSSGMQYSRNPAIYTTELHNEHLNTRFYIIRHEDTNSLDNQTFDLRITTPTGERLLDRQSLVARESKILITGYRVGEIHIAYSTSELLTWQTIDGVDTVFYVLGVAEQVEVVSFYYHGTEGTDILYYEGASTVDIDTDSSGSLITLSITREPTQEMVYIRFNDVFSIVYLSKQSAYRFWAPVLQEGPGTPNVQDQVLVQGPYLVRNVTATDSTLHLVGDVNEDTSMLLWVTTQWTEVTWNGNALHLEPGPFFARRTMLDGPDKKKVRLPCLNCTETEWKVIDSLPEIDSKYDDSAWVTARDMSTNELFPPATLPCLYAGEYGFHTGTVVYRGRFNGSQPAGDVAGVHLEIWGGTAFGYTAWLNGKFFASVPGNAWSEWFINYWKFAPGDLHDGENILVILNDSNGYDRDDGHTTKKPRGIRSARLLGTTGLRFTSWTLQGNAGGENHDDAVRAPYNEDGFYAERIGAHFPGFDDSSWHAGSPIEGFPAPGIRFYRTKVNISYPEDYDVPIAFVFDMPLDTKTRVELFVNGYQMGRYVNHIGPQSIFPVYPGIINRGENVIGLLVWGMNSPKGGEYFRFTKLSLEAVDILRTGYGPVDGDGLVTTLPPGRRKFIASGQKSTASDNNNEDSIFGWANNPATRGPWQKFLERYLPGRFMCAWLRC